MSREATTIKSKIDTGTLAIGTTSTQMEATNRELARGVNIRAGTFNTGTVFVGNKTVHPSNGYPLVAGESVFIPVSDIESIWVVADAVAQEFSWIAI